MDGGVAYGGLNYVAGYFRDPDVHVDATQGKLPDRKIGRRVGVEKKIHLRFDNLFYINTFINDVIYIVFNLSPRKAILMIMHIVKVSFDI